MKIEINLKDEEDIRFMKEYIFFMQNRNNLFLKKEEEQLQTPPVQEEQPAVIKEGTKYEDYLKIVKDKQNSTKKGFFKKIKFKIGD
jgi:hypothetical protein